MVRRALIVLLSLGWGAAALLLLGRSILPDADAQPLVSAQVPGKEPVQLPCTVGDLTALQLGLYEGPFPEDGSQRPVADTAALLIKNTGAQPVERGAVMLTVGEETLVFEIYALPPGETALVMEAERKRYTTRPITSCDGWAVQTQWKDFADILAVEEAGLDTLVLTNLSESRLRAIRLLYKSYDGAGGIFIGGVCHTAYIDDLQPEEQVRITPYRYVSGYSRVVAVVWE